MSESAGVARRAPPAWCWAAAAMALLALARWLSALSLPWLLLAALGALGWSAGLRRPLRAGPVGVALLLWLALGAAFAVQLRLDGIVARWDAVADRTEERAAAALRDALDDLFDRGTRSVAEVERLAAHRARGTADATLFAELERIRSQAGISALAVYDADGLPVAWAGEHRGMIPETVRRGVRAASFVDGPLFQYVYFTRGVGRGYTVVSAALMHAMVDPGQAQTPFAERFAGRYGATPRFLAPERARGDALWDWSTAEGPVFSVSFDGLTQRDWWDRTASQGRRLAALAWAAAMLAAALLWYRSGAGPPALPVALLTGAALLMPVGDIFGVHALFSPIRFVLPEPLALPLGETLLLLGGTAVGLLALGPPRRRVAAPPWMLPIGAAALFPAVLWLLRGATAPGLLAAADGGGFALQLAGILALALPLYALLRLVEPRLPERGPHLAWLGVLLAAAMGALWAITWTPARAWPAAAVAAAWTAPYLLVALGRSPWRGPLRVLGTWLAIGWVAGTLVLATLWTEHLAVRIALAEDEIERLGTEPDPYLDFLLRQFAEAALHSAAEGEQGVNLLYRAWVTSGLAREGEEARITTWRGTQPEAELRLSDLRLPPGLIEEMMPEAVGAETPILRRFDRAESVHYLLLVPLPGERVISVVVPPRRHLGKATALSRFLDPASTPELEDDRQVLTLVPVAEPVAALDAERAVRWRPTAEGWRSETDVAFPAGYMHAHLLIRALPPPLVVVRGILVLAAAGLVLSLIFALARSLCGEPFGLSFEIGRATRTFRGRLTLTLLGFFLLPTLALGAVAFGAVSREVVRTASALATRSLQDAVLALSVDPVARLGPRLGRDLVLYRHGVLVDAVAPEILDLGLFQTWLPPEVMLGFRTGEDAEASEERRVGGSRYLVVYRRLNAEEVIGAPIALAAGEIARRQREFADIIGLVALLGVALSAMLALAVGRALTRPIEELSRAAAAVGAGNLRLRLPGVRRDEFGGVYRSFNRMVRRLRQTQAALLRETRRTELIVAEAATGVLALDAAGRVALVNPRALQIVEGELERGAPLPRTTPLICAVADAVDRFFRGGATEHGAEVEVEGRTIRLRLRRLRATKGVEGGAVLALEDITPEVRSARVLAWGEMARQVAHEIKNPLTPIKLSVQHLRRAYHDRRPDYERILENNVESVLREIDRLGEIARAFARFGTPAADGGALEAVDLGAVAEETLALYRGGEDGIAYHVRVEAGAPPALARTGELKEVLVNLLENAREALNGDGGEIRIRVATAGAGQWVALDVEDTGEGIPAELLPRIFDPQFSTRSSGTGLGLAIVRRLVEGWGGEVTAGSRPGEGAVVHLRLRAAG